VDEERRVLTGLETHPWERVGSSMPSVPAGVAAQRILRGMPSEDRWIDDYLSVGLVDWPEGLRSHFESMLRRSTRKLLMWLLISPGGLLFGVAIAFAGYNTAVHPVTSAIALSLCAIGILGLPLTMLLGNDAHKVRISAKKALRCDRPERFELGHHVEEEAAAARALGVKATLDGVPRALIIEPGSSLLLQVDDAPAQALKEVHVRKTAHVEFAPELINQTGRRPLDTAERDELRRHIRSKARSIWWVYPAYTVVTLTFGMLCYSLIVMHALPKTDLLFSIMTPIAWIGGTWFVFGPFRIVRRSLARFRRDLRAGMTEIVEGHVAVKDLRESGRLVHDPIVNPSVVRRLSESGIWWEIDGTPAPWRRS